jgi:5-methylcytosine-specific restriction endonuclease McrA
MAESNLSPEFRPVTRAEAKIMGAKRYFTGKPCRRGHVAERYISSQACIECYQQKCGLRFEKNPLYATEKAMKWNKENKNKHKEIHNRWYQNNKEKHSISVKKWAQKNGPAIKLAKLAWRKANPEADQAKSRNRRARKRNAEGRHTAADVQRIFDAQRGKCAHCLTGIKAGYHVDHIQPISRGGSNWPRNLQLLCAPCNLRKNAADPIDFAKREGKLL